MPDGSPETDTTVSAASHGASEGHGGSEAGGEEPVSDWLLPHRVAVPEPSAAHLHRSELAERCNPTNRRLTVLLAGGGFGKTTLLAQCCRELRDRGIPVAWLSVQEQDDAVLLDNYLASAFEAAGIDVLGPLQQHEEGLDIPRHRTELVARAIAAHDGPCVLALDELERLTDAESVALLNFLFRTMPVGLHVAVACREIPRGLDIATSALEGHAEIVSAEDLRFSRQEIAELFGGELSRRQLAEIAAESGGWPIALRIRRNEWARRPRKAGRMMRDVLESWIESRLWGDVAEADRDFLLDAALLEWMDADLLRDVLLQPDAMGRLECIAGLEGLIEPLRGRSGTCRLHPLVREHCVARRRRETPERYLSMQRRIAEALARRGETVAAMRHGAEAMDAGLVGRILADAGAVRLWLEEGTDRLVAADRYLTEEAVAAHPRLGLVRCMALNAAGRPRESRRAFGETLALWGKAGILGDPELALDRYVFVGIMAHNGYESMDSAVWRAQFAESARIADTPSAEPFLRGIAEYAMCFGTNHRAEFAAATRWATRARRRVGERAPYMRMMVDFQLGQIAMAQGRVRDAEACYGRGVRLAKGRFLRELRMTVCAEVLAAELTLERGIARQNPNGRGLAMDLYRACPQFSAYAAASELRVDAAREAEGMEGAVSAVEEMYDHAVESHLPMLQRYLGAKRVELLAHAGRVGEAERAWRDAGLPDGDDRCLDLDGQSWREMEALALARLRLCTASGDLEAGRRFVRGAVRLATERRLRRTSMRLLALWSTLEELGGDPVAAVGRVAEFLRLFDETDYARPLVREGDIAIAVLERFLDAHADSTLRERAMALRRAARCGEVLAVPHLSARETEILARLETQTDREIAAALEISRDGVRYHVQRMFRKLGAHGRAEAVRRARQVGALPDAAEGGYA